MKKRSREALAPDITPLIDVVFLLLIFFMVSTVFKKDELALLLDLPKAQEGQAVSKSRQGIVIELAKEDLAYNGKKLQVEDLSEKLSAISNKESAIELRVDQDVAYKRLVLILDLLKKNKLSNLELVTQK